MTSFSSQPPLASTSQQPQSEDGKGESQVPDDIFDFYEKLDNEEEEVDAKVVSFEVSQDHLETLQKRFEIIFTSCVLRVCLNATNALISCVQVY